MPRVVRVRWGGCRGLQILRRHRFGEAVGVTEADGLGLAAAVALGLLATDAAIVGAGDGGGFANRSSHIQRSPV